MSQQFTAEADISGSIEPTGFEVTWSENQIAVHYDGEVSVIPLDDDGMISHQSDHTIAASHNSDIIDLGIGAYDEHMVLHE